MSIMELHFKFTDRDASQLLSVLILFEICLVLIFGVDVLFGIPEAIRPLFDLDGEATIPAWFSSMQLFLIGILLLLTARRSPSHQVISAGLLTCIGIGFIFLSMDEAAVFHEKITLALEHIEWVPRFKGNHGIWIPVYLAIGGIIVFINRPTIHAIWKHYPRETLISTIGIVIFLVGAVGMEIISYQYLRDGAIGWLYTAEVAIEELLEMVGISILLYGTILFVLREQR